MLNRTFFLLTLAILIMAALGAGSPIAASEKSSSYTGLADLIPLALFLLLALGVSFLCSILEAVLLSVGPGQVQMMVEDGKKSGRILKNLRSNLDRSLSAILTLNTVAHTAGAAGVGAEVARVFGNTYLGIASVILTLLVLVLSEIIPKTLGARHASALASKSAILIHWLSLLLLPVVILLQGISTLLFGKANESTYSRVELIAMAGLAGQEGDIGKAEAGMVQNMLRLKVLTVRDIMTPMTVAFCLDESLTVRQAIKEHMPIKFSRVPLRNQEGHLKRYFKYTDLLRSHYESADEKTLSEIAFPLKNIADSASVFDSLQMLTDGRDEMVLVLNEFGQEIGLVTREDILEAIAGKAIADEDDEHASPRDYALEQSKTRGSTES